MPVNGDNCDRLPKSRLNLSMTSCTRLEIKDEIILNNDWAIHSENVLKSLLVIRKETNLQTIIKSNEHKNNELELSTKSLFQPFELLELEKLNYIILKLQSKLQKYIQMLNFYVFWLFFFLLQEMNSFHSTF